MAFPLLEASRVRKARFLIDSKDAFNLIHKIARHDGPRISFIDAQADIAESQKMFSPEIFNCEDILKKLNMMEVLIKNYNIEVTKWNDIEIKPLESMSLDTFKKDLAERLALINGIIDNYTKLQEKYDLMNEKHQLFEKLSEFYGSYFYKSAVKNDKENLPIADLIDHPTINCLLGTVNPRMALPLQRVLLKSTHGNIIWKQDTIYANEDRTKTKVGFLVFFQSQSLKEQIINLSYSFNATIFDVVDREDENLEAQHKKIYAELLEINHILSSSKDLLLKDLNDYATDIFVHRQNINASLLIYRTLNCMQLEGQVFKAYIWYLKSDHQDILNFVLKHDNNHLTNIQEVHHKKEEEPTHYPLTTGFKGFQYLITSYGIPKRNELNPMIFVLVTFPIFFGLMFGDIGHGSIIIAACYIYSYSKGKSLSDSESSFLTVVASCGICAIFAGFLYNDIFSKPFFSFFHSYEIFDNTKHSWSGFGLGSKWFLSVNKINFLNDFKMKLSLIIAYFHQLFGLILSIINHKKNHQIDEIFLSDLPRILLFNNIVGYMVFWIFYKWIFITRDSSNIPPLMPIILDYLMNKKGRKSYLYGQLLIENCMLLSIILLTSLIICGKPLRLYYKKRKGNDFISIEDSTSFGAGLAKNVANKEFNQPKEEENDSTEIIMHFVESFEFILSIGSNTASYLRIWALSLAHSVLSEIFWMTIMKSGFRVSSYYVIDVFFMVFSCLAWQAITIGFMVAMEGMSASLHSLRLHWVEFQSKFFKGNSTKFTPVKY